MRTNHLKDLFPRILENGDVATLVEFLKVLKPLKEEQDRDYGQFWKNAFEMYFPEYAIDIEETLPWLEQNKEMYRKLCLWLTYAHNRILRYLDSRFSGEFDYSNDKFIGIVSMGINERLEQPNINTRMIIYKGVSMSLRRWVKDVLGEKSGRLMSVFSNIYTHSSTRRGDTYQNMDKKALRYFLFYDLSQIFRWENTITVSNRLNSNDTYLRRIKADFYNGDKVVESETFKFFAWARGVWSYDNSQFTGNDQIELIAAFEEINPMPLSDHFRKKRTLFLGKCINCKNVAAYVQPSTCLLFCSTECAKKNKL